MFKVDGGNMLRYMRRQYMKRNGNGRRFFSSLYGDIRVHANGADFHVNMSKKNTENALLCIPGTLGMKYK